MKKISIYEPAMCCSTGLCGVSVDPELLRISTVLNTLSQNGIEVGRYNLTNAPTEFVNHKVVQDFLQENGADKLPILVVEEAVVISGRYPTNEEFVKILDLTPGILVVEEKNEERSCGCNCKEGCC